MAKKVDEATTRETSEEHAKKFDLDNIDVKEIKEHIKKVLEELADSDAIPDKDAKQREDLKQCAEDIAKLIDGYDPNGLADADRDLYGELARANIPPGTSPEKRAEMEREKELERDEMWYAYRGHMQRRVGIILEIATREEFSHTSEGRDLLIGIMTSMARNGDPDMTAGFEAEFTSRSGVSRNEMRRITDAVLALGQTPPQHFEEFYKENFEGEDPADRPIIVDAIERADLEVQQVMLKRVKDLLPEEERNSALWRHKVEKPDRLPPEVHSARGKQQAEEFMEDWQARIETEGGSKIAAEDGNRYVTQEKLWGVIKYEKTNQVTDTVKMVNRGVWVKREDGTIAEEDIKVASIDLFTDAPLSFLLKSGPEIGKAHEKGRDRITHVKFYHTELDDVVQAEELRRLWSIPPAIKEADGTITLPFQDETVDGVPKPGSFNCSEKRYLNDMAAIHQTIQNFNEKGLYYAEQKALQDKKKAVYERRWGSDYEPRPTSSAETEFVRSYLEEELERAALEAEANPETAYLAPHIRQAIENINATCTEHEVTYGHMDKYQKLAAQRLRQRGIDEGNPNWADLVEKELTYVIEYFRAQDISLKDTGQLVLERADMANEPGATDEITAANKLMYYQVLANLDHEIEVAAIVQTASSSSLAREVLNIEVPEGQNVYDTVEQTVIETFRPLLRDTETPGAREAELQDVRVDAQMAFNVAKYYMNGEFRNVIQNEANERVLVIRDDNGIPDAIEDADIQVPIAAILVAEVRDEYTELAQQLDQAMLQFEAEATQMLARTPESLVGPQDVARAEEAIQALRMHRQTNPEEHAAIEAYEIITNYQPIIEVLETATEAFDNVQQYTEPDRVTHQTRATEHAREFIERYPTPATPATPAPGTPTP